MEETIVHIAIPYTFCDEGQYIICLDKKNIILVMKYVQSAAALDSITEMTTVGNITITPDDPEGLANHSKITIRFPFLIFIKTINDEFDEDKELEYYHQIRMECIRYLNRLREVIQHFTNRYWIRSISPSHVNIYNIEWQYEDGRKQGYHRVGTQEGSSFPIKIKEQTCVSKEIREALLQNSKIPLSERLYFDSLNFFNYGRYQEAIINANTAMEVRLIEQITKVAQINRKTDDEVVKILDDISTPKKFESKIKRAFLRNITAQAFNELEIIKKLKRIRDKRGNVVHPYVKFFGEEETRLQLLDIYNIMTWIKEQKLLTTK